MVRANLAWVASYAEYSHSFASDVQIEMPAC